MNFPLLDITLKGVPQVNLTYWLATVEQSAEILNKSGKICSFHTPNLA